MVEINRESFSDARQIAENLLPDHDVRHSLLNFLSNAIIYSNGLRPDNWNLNLDKHGRFIRFNVGHEYCIEIFRNYNTILVIRDILKNQLAGKKLKVEYTGFEGKEQITTDDLHIVPDCLVKVPGSVACHINNDDIIDTIPAVEEANRSFISYAIQRTVQLPSMRKAHSIGFISYLSDFISKNIPNPSRIVYEEKLYENREKEESELRKLNLTELLEKTRNNNYDPPKPMSVNCFKYERNPYVAAYAKRIANGICQDCNESAPFLSKLTNEPFLETHHIKPLAEGGLDTVENTLAICPNCHRKRHYG